MCEKCEDDEKRKAIEASCDLCSGKKSEKSIELNQLIIDQKTALEEIEKEAKKKHIELINGYDKQLEDCLRDAANDITKMLLMLEDYKKCGDIDAIRKLLRSISNYALMAQMNVNVAIQTTNALENKLLPEGRN
jgi:hypothetical protein